ncbi:3-keto-disaccharide hydrolase [Roseibacillus persicicus]|uniref:Glycosyl hydrolase n=1 Tax=Roseibacillus persicicus TaxID=454148 RepID=A0A918TJF4_9BACT|nr:DUF1080 domain-containing protein [Roseibacillus persicicus]GHC48493.1 glycosyl hydrolase [Roseibacillus persicicus]
MKFLLPLLFLAAPLFAEPAAQAEPNQLSAEEKEAGWELLFDGKTIEHFRNYKKEGVKDAWQVQDGVLILTKKGGGDIITKKEFEAFELTLDYKISKEGNSGLMFHVQEISEKPWHTGAEIQIQDNVDGHDPEKSGWLYQLYKPEPIVDATNPAGEWNTLRILITPEKCVHWMNGTKYVEYVKGSEDWNERVAASKFADKPHFGKPTKGHLCLQDHGNIVSFRNIKVREIEEK